MCSCIHEIVCDIQEIPINETVLGMSYMIKKKTKKCLCIQQHVEISCVHGALLVVLKVPNHHITKVSVPK